MRLLHTKKLELEEFVGHPPGYAILSHTWGDQEVTFNDIQTPTSPSTTSKAGWSKIKAASAQANRDGYDYIWIDTCCIDKSSSAELSEAINSMFRWYTYAVVCYVYLVDVLPKQETSAWNDNFGGCRWFTRGWTLQELLAPDHIELFATDWSHIGSKRNISKQINRITGIDEEFLIGRPLSHASIAKRMSWASNRQTTRVEDVAYSLLGIFDVNMPLLYGEGRKAFFRLQEEIMKISHDQSLFAWNIQVGIHSVRALLVDSPAEFKGSGLIVPYPNWRPKQPALITSLGFQLEVELSKQSDSNYAEAALACHFEDNYRDVIVMNLALVGSENVYERRAYRPLETVSRKEWMKRSPARTVISVIDDSSLFLPYRATEYHHLVLRLCPLSRRRMVMDCLNNNGKPGQHKPNQNTTKFTSDGISWKNPWQGVFGLKTTSTNGYDFALTVEARFRFVKEGLTPRSRGRALNPRDTEQEVCWTLKKVGMDSATRQLGSVHKSTMNPATRTATCTVSEDTFDFTLSFERAYEMILRIDIWSNEELASKEIKEIRHSRESIFEFGS